MLRSLVGSEMCIRDRHKTNLYSSQVFDHQPEWSNSRPDPLSHRPEPGWDADGHPVFLASKQREQSSAASVFINAAVGVGGETASPRRVISNDPATGTMDQACKSPTSHAEQYQSHLPYMPLEHEEKRFCLPSLGGQISYRPQVRLGDGTTIPGSPQRRKHPSGADRYEDQSSW
eukprot:TRINITY_DN20878_c0_g1_i2.p1 TRINITY_DN20878_c0_g1~~TRINITY_DN20878_c0_g1_i2.p1  ORF type:complete len:200 (+),score=45.43 TRINITY_DN20878_c0_g1_i2:81-602(+)